MARVGILNFPGHMNQGANLTSYALQRIVKEMGYEVANLHLHDNYVVKKNPNYTDFSDSNISMTPNEAWGEYGMQQYNRDFDTFIVGSDQVWRHIEGENMFAWKTKHEFCFYLGFAEPGKRRVAMAASFGRDDYSASASVRERCAEELNRFAAISVREKSAEELVKKIADVKVEQVVDPVFFLSADEWNEFATPVNEERKGTFIAYNSFFSARILEEIEGKLPSDQKFVSLLKGNTAEWLGNIRDARFVISDSYHVCCFCLIFGTPFVVLTCKKQGKARFDELAETFGFSTQRVINTDEVQDLPAAIWEVLELPHDQQPIWDKIAQCKEMSYNWLRTALSAPIPEWRGPSFRKACAQDILKEKLRNQQYRSRMRVLLKYYVCMLLYYTCPFRRTFINKKYKLFSWAKHHPSW